MADDDADGELDFSFVLASSVHDMKNSLGMLLTSLEQVIEKTAPVDDEQARLFAVLEYEAARINGELIQLLALYRMENQAMLVQVDEHYVVDILEDQVARNDMLFQTRRLEVVLDCDEDLHWYLDGELVGGVINNILVNSARYCRQRLQLSAAVEGDFLCLSIADDGQGYPQSMLDAPRQENAGVSFNSGSTNLGLLFAHRVAELHRSGARAGRIELSNGGPLGGGLLRILLP